MKNYRILKNGEKAEELKTAMDIIIKRYYAQVQHYLMVGNFNFAYVCAIFGNNRWDYRKVNNDLDYQDNLYKQEKLFWDCVVNNIEPQQ